MLTRWVVIGCLLPGTGIAAGQVPQGGPEGPASGATFFTDPAAFDQALQAASKTSKAFWNFSPTNFVPGSIVHVEDPLDIITHPVLAPGIWDNPDGTTSWPPELDNVRFVGGEGGLHVPPTEPGPGLYFATTGYQGIEDNLLGVDLFSSFGGTFHILSGPPAGDNHTAMALEIFALRCFRCPPPLYHVTVYDDTDQQIGKFIQAAGKTETIFVGIIAGVDQTIGRVELFDEAGGAPCISSIEVYRSSGTPPTCPWDCGIPVDSDVGIVDFLAVLAEWGMVGTPCDFDGGGVGITDFLTLLGNWGPCPGISNDECVNKIILDRSDPAGTIIQAVDMAGMTASPEPNQCTGQDPNLSQDTWYCLQNNTTYEKVVTVTGTVNVLAEVTAGCACPPGALVACGSLTAGGATFNMQPGEQVCLRLINTLDLPDDQLDGDLIITNEVVPLVNFFTGQIAFISAVIQAGKTFKLDWSFDPHSQDPATEVAVPDPLDINTHSGNPDDPWTETGPLDLWPPEVDNVQFTTNLNPQGALVPGNDLAFATAGASPDINTNLLRENTPNGSLAILSGPPAGDNHTAMAFRISGTVGALPDVVPTQFHVTVYDTQDVAIGEVTLNGLNGEVIFIGFITVDPSVTIGRVDIWDSNGSSEGITRIWAASQ